MTDIQLLSQVDQLAQAGRTVRGKPTSKPGVRKAGDQRSKSPERFGVSLPNSPAQQATLFVESTIEVVSDRIMTRSAPMCMI